MNSKSELKAETRKCRNKNCKTPIFMEWAHSRNQLCSFCRWDMEKKLAKIQGRKPDYRNITGE